MPCSHNMNFKVARLPYCSHYTTFCFVIGNLGVVAICLISKLRFVMMKNEEKDEEKKLDERCRYIVVQQG